ncbi:Sodium-coupled neutral amino acid transporter 9-like [Holothuria leucospilota]|uniref:Sodium-coupled neutral amino acid transporter 9-like n=1 Tax=Holothuria leucospilota TaxID=206669 RepID=A0A9Q1C7T1_HOLLE|nr:Sodium-coupled neutral amino acid transporter 9-like [Holothuria leucospilota]
MSGNGACTTTPPVEGQLINDQEQVVNYLSSDVEQKTEPQIENELVQTKKRRKPFHYSSIPTYINNDGTVQTPVDVHTAATYNRYRYYSRLGHPQDNTLAIPDHVLPSYIFSVNVPFIASMRDREGKQSSLITIFSIWNTMMGTSLLSMPWAIHQAGFAMGIFFLISMAGITLYTCYRVVQSVSKQAGQSGMVEFSDVCRLYLGKWGEFISILFSLVALLGAMVVYWVLMSNFLYSTVAFIYGEIKHEINENTSDVLCDVSWSRVIPVNESFDNSNNENSTFDSVWNKTDTVPFFLLFLVVPLINFKSPTFFTKFNALGTLSVAFLLTFVTIKAVNWGFNIDFADAHSESYIKLFSWNFPAFTGLLSLSYFIHNAVASIMRAQRHPENNVGCSSWDNHPCKLLFCILALVSASLPSSCFLFLSVYFVEFGRDMTIAYLLVAATYTFVGLVFYVTFPHFKTCMKDHGVIHVLCLNFILLTVCVLFAVFLPSIGVIIRFSGAFCGLAYIFTLPCLVYMADLKEQGKLRWYHIAIHGVIMVLGVINLIAQFVILFFE